MKNILDDHLANKEEGEFETFKMFNEAEHAGEIVELLKENDIPFKIEKSEYLIDSAIVGSTLTPKIILKLPPEDFTQANKLIEKSITESAEIPENHYFKDFSNEELRDVLLKPEEWSSEDRVYSKLFLKQRGIKLDETEIQNQIDARLEEIRKGKKGNKIWMAIYFLITVFGSILFLPILIIAGIGMGWYYWKGKDVDFMGQRYFVYEPETRKVGNRIFIIGCIIMAVYTIPSWLGVAFNF